MGNLCSSEPAAPAAAAPSSKQSLGRQSNSSSAAKLNLNRISSGLKKISGRVLGWGGQVRGKAAAANARHQLEDRLSEVIQAKAAAPDAAARPKVKFNRLLLRFGTLSEGFCACRDVFKRFAGSEDAELTLDQARDACKSLGYHLDDESLRRIFVSVDENEDSRLNSHEFVALLAILHILKGPEDEEKVDPTILKTWQTAEDAFLCFDSSRQGRLDKKELLAGMHEGSTDVVRHSATGRGDDPIKSIAQRRFDELDRDGSGEVSFLEFLFCLEGWVEDAEEE